MNAERILRQHLEDLQRAGVTHAPSGVAEVVSVLLSKRAAAPTVTASAPAKPLPTAEIRVGPQFGRRAQNQAAAAASVQTPQPISPTSRPTQVNAPASTIAKNVVAQSDTPSVPTNGITMSNLRDDSLSLDDRITELGKVAERVAACRKCQELAETRTQTVFGVGNPDADIMFIGEAPGADEDEQGEPFVGKAGQLLNSIIAACKLTREEIYICNVLRCRPPGNRTPTPIEAGHCREFLDAQIALVKPRYIICWGATAAQNLLNSETTIGKMRGKFYDYHGIKVVCTYHPSYLNRNPSAKKLVWEDMKFFRADMGVVLA